MLCLMQDLSTRFQTRELTFAGLHALNPPVLHFSVPGSSAVLKPGTARSATTDSTGFVECAALRTCHYINNHCGDGWCAD